MRETLTSRVPSTPTGARGSVLVARRIAATDAGSALSGLFEGPDGRVWVAAAGAHDPSEASTTRLGETLAELRAQAEGLASPAVALDGARARIGPGAPVTAFVAALEPGTGRLASASAGRLEAFVVREGRVAPHAGGDAPALWSGPGAAIDREVTLAPGDTLVVTPLALEAVAAAAAACAAAPLDDLVFALVADALGDGADGALALGLRHDEPAAGGPRHALELAIPSELDAIGVVNDHLDAFAAAHGIPSAPRRALDIALDDLLSNIVSYGYAGEAGHVVDVAIELADGALSATLADDGVPFDPFAQEEPDTTLSVEERAIGGLGIHLVRRLMDEVHYERRDGRNVVRLMKRITPSAAPEP